MARETLNISDVMRLVRRVDEKYQPAWQGRTPEEQAAMARYFLPHHSSKAVLGPTRPRVIKWYCPFACQKDFPTGHRYCINVYRGCGPSDVVTQALIEAYAQIGCKITNLGYSPSRTL